MLEHVVIVWDMYEQIHEPKSIYTMKAIEQICHFSAKLRENEFDTKSAETSLENRPGVIRNQRPQTLVNNLVLDS